MVVIQTIVATIHMISPATMEMPSERAASVQVPASPMSPKDMPNVFSGTPDTGDGRDLLFGRGCASLIVLATDVGLSFSAAARLPRSKPGDVRRLQSVQVRGFGGRCSG